MALSLVWTTAATHQNTLRTRSRIGENDDGDDSVDTPNPRSHGWLAQSGAGREGSNTQRCSLDLGHIDREFYYGGGGCGSEAESLPKSQSWPRHLSLSHRKPAGSGDDASGVRHCHEKGHGKRRWARKGIILLGWILGGVVVGCILLSGTLSIIISRAARGRDLPRTAVQDTCSAADAYRYRHREEQQQQLYDPGVTVAIPTVAFKLNSTAAAGGGIAANTRGRSRTPRARARTRTRQSSASLPTSTANSAAPHRLPLIDRSILAKLDRIEQRRRLKAGDTHGDYDEHASLDPTSQRNAPPTVTLIPEGRFSPANKPERSDTSTTHHHRPTRLADFNSSGICDSSVSSKSSSTGPNPRLRPCRFLLPLRVAEQESKARLHFLQLAHLAQRLDRILVLPNVAKSRMGACFRWEFARYYDATASTTGGGDHPFDFGGPGNINSTVVIPEMVVNGGQMSTAVDSEGMTTESLHAQQQQPRRVKAVKMDEFKMWMDAVTASGDGASNIVGSKFNSKPARLNARLVSLSTSIPQSILDDAEELELAPPPPPPPPPPPTAQNRLSYDTGADGGIRGEGAGMVMKQPKARFYAYDSELAAESEFPGCFPSKFDALARALADSESAALFVVVDPATRQHTAGTAVSEFAPVAGDAVVVALQQQQRHHSVGVNQNSASAGFQSATNISSDAALNDGMLPDQAEGGGPVSPLAGVDAYSEATQGSSSAFPPTTDDAADVLIVNWDLRHPLFFLPDNDNPPLVKLDYSPALHALAEKLAPSAERFPEAPPPPVDDDNAQALLPPPQAPFAPPPGLSGPVDSNTNANSNNKTKANTNLATTTAGAGAAYLAIHWRMETVEASALSECAHALVDVLSETLHDDVRTVWFASDYPYPVAAVAPPPPPPPPPPPQGSQISSSSTSDSSSSSSATSRVTTVKGTTAGGSGSGSSATAKSGTFRNFGQEHIRAVAILRDAFKPGGELAGWTLTDISEAIGVARIAGTLGKDEEELVGDVGVLGIVDKMMAMKARLFVTGSKKCSRQSSFTKQVVERRAEEWAQLANVVTFF